MKNYLLTLVLLVAMATNAQKTYWTHYSFKVAPQDEAAVFALIDGYFKENKNEVFEHYESEIQEYGRQLYQNIIFHLNTGTTVLCSNLDQWPNISQPG